MTTIHAGNTLVQQYAPPFVISDGVATNWHLRYNATLLAFEAYDPDELVVDAGFDTIESALFLNVSNQQVFVVPWQAATEASLYITHNGVKQHTDAFGITSNSASNTTTITMSDPIISGDVEVIGLQTTGGASIQIATATADGVADTVNLNWLAPSTQSLLVTLDGIKQDVSAYSISSNATFTATTVTFNTAPSVSVSAIASITAGGSGYTALDILTVTGGTFTTPATIRVDTIGGGGDVLTATLLQGGVYSVLPGNPVSVTGGTGGDDATFNLSSVGQSIEIVGITTTGEVPASPVQATNLGLGFGVFVTKTVACEQQIFNFKSLVGGTNVTLGSTTDSITINAAQLALTQSGAGGSTLFDNNDPGAGVFKTVQAGSRIALSTTGTTPNQALVVTYNLGYKNVVVGTDGDPYVALAAERLFSVSNLATATQEITLVNPSTLPSGDTITVKDQDGSAGTNALTLTPAAGNIDGAGNYVINTAYGYVTLYSDGTNYRIIAEG